MANIAIQEHQSEQAHDRFEYRLYLAIALPLCFAFAVLRRLTPGAKANGGVFQEATGNARSIIPWIFSGR
ncbi:MAG: hypothetical protein AAFW81_10700 [Pseudomonadota bacterium]